MEILKWLTDSVNNLSKSSLSKTAPSKNMAKDRMRNMLVQDRLELPAGRIEIMEEELLAVVSRYFELDREMTRFNLKQYERKAALTADFHLLRSKC